MKKTNLLFLLLLLSSGVFAQFAVSIVGTNNWAGVNGNVQPVIWTSPMRLCNAASVILQANVTGGSATSYSWSGPGTVGPFSNQFTPTPTFTTVYSVTVTNAFGQTATASFTIIPTPIVPIVSQMPDPVCNGNPLQFQVSGLAGPFYSYNWYLTNDGINPFSVFGNPINTVASYPPFNATYTLNISNPGVFGCNGFLEGSSKVISSPCTIGILHTALALTSYNSTTVSIQNSVEVAGTVNLTNCNVFVSPNAEILVKTGATLTITGSWLHACACRWRGIRVETGGTLIVENASIIEDADDAIATTLDNGFCDIRLKNSIINKCTNGIFARVSPTVNLNGHLVIDRSIFTCRDIGAANIYNNIPQFVSLHQIYELERNITGANPNILGFNTSNDIESALGKPRAILTNGRRTNAGLIINGHTNSKLIPINNTSGGATIFDNMEYGVYAEISSIKIEDCHFMYLEGNNTFVNYQGNVAPTGIGVFCFDFKAQDNNSICEVFQCDFHDVCRGIDIENITNVYLNLNGISSNSTSGNYNVNAKAPGQYGIYYSTNENNFGSVKYHITENYVRNHYIGVSIIRNNKLSSLTNEIKCNTIFGSSTTNRFCNIGLFMSDGMVASLANIPGQPKPDGETEASRNDIIRCVRHAIQIKGVRQYSEFIKSKNASVTLISPWATYLPSGAYGPFGFTLGVNTRRASTIMIENSENLLFQENQVRGYYFDGFPFQVYRTNGFNIFQSSNIIVRGNSVLNNYHNIVFNSKCTPTAVLRNFFTAANDALYFINDAEIGNQGTPTQTTGNTFDVSSKLKFITNVANPVSNPNVTSPFYYRVFGLEDMPNNRQTNSGPASLGLKYSSTSFGLNAITAAPYNFPIFPGGCALPTPIPPPIDKELGILNFTDSVKLVKDLINDSLPNQRFANNKWWENKMRAYRLIKQNVSFVAQEAVIANFYANMQNDDIDKLNSVYTYTELGDLQNAELNNNLISLVRPETEKRKNLNSIVLRKMNDPNYILTTTDISELESIAYACPDELGKVVYEAQNELMILQRQVIDFGEPCLSANARMIQIEEDKQLNETNYYFNLFPNPNNGNFNLETLNGNEFTGTIVITDVLGKVVLVNDWINASNLEINLNNTTKPGLYFIQIKNANGESIYTSKFMFN